MAQQSGSSRTARLTVIYLFGSVTAGAIAFFSVPLFTRAMGPERYGELALVLTVSMAVSGILAFGSDVVLARFWFDRDDEADRLDLARQWITFLTAWSLVIGAACAFIVYTLRDLISPTTDLGASLALGVLVLAPQLVFLMLAQVLRNQFRAWWFAVLSILEMLLRSVFGLFLVVQSDLGIVGVLLGMAVADMVSIAVLLALVRIRWTGPIRRADLGPMLRFGLPIIPGSIAFWAYSGLDRLVLARNVPLAELGAYAAASSLVGALLVLKTALGQAWLPSLTQQYVEAPALARAMIRTWGELAVLVFGSAAICLALIGRPLLAVFAGESFSAGAVALPFLALGQVFNIVAIFAASGSTLAKRSAWIPVITGGAVIAELLLLVVLIPLWGLAGASVSVATGYFIMTVGFLIYSQRTFPVALPRVVLGAETLALFAAAAAATWLPAGAASWLIQAAVLIAFAARAAALLLRHYGGGQSSQPVEHRAVGR